MSPLPRVHTGTQRGTRGEPWRRGSVRKPAVQCSSSRVRVTGDATAIDELGMRREEPRPNVATTQSIAAHARAGSPRLKPAASFVVDAESPSSPAHHGISAIPTLIAVAHEHPNMRPATGQQPVVEAPRGMDLTPVDARPWVRSLAVQRAEFSCRRFTSVNRSPRRRMFEPSTLFSLLSHGLARGGSRPLPVCLRGGAR